MARLLVLLALVGGCAAPTHYDAVYIDPVGYNHLLGCEKETVPDGREVLFCSKKERATW